MYNPLEEFSFSDPFETWWPFIFAALVGIVTTLRSYIVGPSCSFEGSITGKIAIVTGGSSGVGLAVVMELADRGAKIYIGTRYIERTKAIIKSLVDNKKLKSANDIIIQELNLASFKSVKAFAQSIDEPCIDILINNAGVAFQPNNKTEDGFETHLQVNYLSHFLLTHLLQQKLRNASTARIINVSAHIHHKGDINIQNLNLEEEYSSSAAFAQSKLALILFTRRMAKFLQDTNVTINAVNPGLVRGTNHVNKSLLNQSFWFKLMAAPTAWLLMKTPKQAAQTIIYLATSPEVKEISGRYFSNCAELLPSEKAMDYELGRQLYQKSMEITGLK